jgi:hypothetical protein
VELVTAHCQSRTDDLIITSDALYRWAKRANVSPTRSLEPISCITITIPSLLHLVSSPSYIHPCFALPSLGQSSWKNLMSCLLLPACSKRNVCLAGAAGASPCGTLWDWASMAIFPQSQQAAQRQHSSTLLTPCQWQDPGFFYGSWPYCALLSAWANDFIHWFRHLH